jgi:hypothetical protein
MQSRFLKQLIYGTLYLVLCAGVGYAMYAFFLRSAPTCFDGKKNQNEIEIDCGGGCVPCEIKKLKPIEAAVVKILDVGGTKTSVILLLRNPNPAYGADKVSYSLVFYGTDGAPMGELSHESFIYPGEIKTIVEVALDLPRAALSRAEVIARADSWKPMSAFPFPEFQTRNIVAKLDASRREAIVSGIVTNQNPFPISRLAVFSILEDEASSPVAASKTLIENISAFESRAFQVTVPSVFLETISPRQVTISLEGER